MDVKDIINTLNNINKTDKLFHIYQRKLYFNTRYGKLKIIKYNGLNKHYEHVFLIEFINTGCIREATFSKIKSGHVRDYLYKSVCGIGYLGYKSEIYKNEDPILYNKLHKKWSHMLERCYAPTNNRYYIYGAIGVRVSDRWHNFSNYYYDVTHMDTFNRDKVISGELTLDKDKLQSAVSKSERIYSNHTCCWLSQSDQYKFADYSIRDKKHSRKIKCIFPDGHEEIHNGIQKFAIKNNLKMSGIYKVINGKCSHHHGFKFELLDL